MNYFKVVLLSNGVQSPIFATQWYISTPLIIFINNPTGDDFDEEKVIAFQASDIHTVLLVKEP